MLIFLQIVWAFIKKYWQVFFGAALVVIGYIVFNKRETSFADRLKAIQEQHDAEIKKINDARLEERAAHEKNVKEMQDTMAEIQKQYDIAKLELDSKKRAEIRRIVEKYQDDPAGLANELSAITGFRVVLPEKSNS
jgi:Skp family chaperone for outer membrane proteins